MKKSDHDQTFAVIVGNREFFPDQLAEEGGKKVVTMLQDLGYRIITLSESDSKGVQTWEDAKKCASLFKDNADKIDGVVVTLPNFGDEKAVADTLRGSHLDVPVLIHAFPDEPQKMDILHRRDSFCGKISVCNNLYQYGIDFTNTKTHVEAVESPEFREDVTVFGGICATVKGLKNARLGVVGVRPNAFKTVRYSEKILERYGISTEIVSLMEIVGRAQELKEDSSEVQQVLKQMEHWFQWGSIPEPPIIKTAKLACAILEWIHEHEIDAVSINCWPAIEKYYEIVPCAAMSIISEKLIPAACETDVMGSLSMYALQLASGTPAGLVDLNNNFGNDLSKCVLFHCGALAPEFYTENPELKCHDMQGYYGSLSGKIAPGPVTLFRVSTDNNGIKGYLAEGAITKDDIGTFGTYGIVEIDNLPKLLRFIVDNGFEHHVAIARGHVAYILEESAKKYLKWDVFRHGSE
ncbi:MAG: L-fucose/L-arabinose isomerase family protein [Candidatus Methanofastidiosia archaeon]|jgi:L-fucose isomerase-like protein